MYKSVTYVDTYVDSFVIFNNETKTLVSHSISTWTEIQILENIKSQKISDWLVNKQNFITF